MGQGFLTGHAISFIALLATVLIYRIYDFWSSGLGNVPGPWYCKLSSLPLVYHEFRGNRTAWIHALHDKYGPVVQIARREVHFNSLEAVRAIYGPGASVRKDDYYQVFKHCGHDHIFSTLETADNVSRRRAMRQMFYHANLDSLHCSGALLSAAQVIVDAIEGDIERSSAVNLHDLFTLFSANVVSKLMYGQQVFPATDTEDACSLPAELREYVINYKRLLYKAGYCKLARVVACLQSFAQVCSRLFGLHSVSRTNKGSKESVSFSNHLTSLEVKSFSLTGTEGISSMHEPVPTSGASPLELFAELRAVVIAGTVTPPAVLVFLLQQLMLAPSLITTIRQESVFHHQQEETEDIQLADVMKQSTLTAVCKEALRLCPPIPMTLPRITLAEIVIDGYRVPQGIKVGCQAYSIHRLESSYRNAGVFDHTRWLSTTSSSTEKAHEVNPELGFWAFSSGPRMCIGRHLAKRELQYVILILLIKFDVELDQGDGNTPNSWTEDVTSFTTRPKKPVYARMKPRDLSKM